MHATTCNFCFVQFGTYTIVVPLFVAYKRQTTSLNTCMHTFQKTTVQMLLATFNFMHCCVLKCVRSQFIMQYIGHYVYQHKRHQKDIILLLQSILRLQDIMCSHYHVFNLTHDILQLPSNRSHGIYGSDNVLKHNTSM